MGKPIAANSNLVNDLRTAILTSDLSRYEIARRSETSEASLSYFVSGKRSLSLDTAAKVATVLGVGLCQVAKAPVSLRPVARNT